ncbi:alpha-galactosidase [Paenibacillus sp. PL91]|uniref:alpha-galactosidase n=1 Tax=Paenibacillus sp. PL91 TaxID=2729538 RepID=UPI00145FCA89|nr:alpha-galactosidase [Paenibacillus sp. PL91]MBC9203764.1 alpha-galactosidase [Paenibacillus sp. PL91]
MNIHFDEKRKIFHLSNKGTSYVMKVLDGGYLVHLYWGRSIVSYNESNPLIFLDRAFAPNPNPMDRSFSLDTIPHEYPVYGNGDYRQPAFQLQLEDGSTISDLRYHSHRIYHGKSVLKGLPATYAENDKETISLEIVLEDAHLGLSVALTYCIFRDHDAISRSIAITNHGQCNIKLLRVSSASVDFRDDEFEWLTLYGSHTNERNIERRPLTHGVQAISSARGASSPQQNPFMALLRKGADESKGEVYAFNLVYSGNFLAQVEVEQYHTCRASIGINPFDFTWLLGPGETFQSPEAVMVFSSDGLGGMSRTYHELYRSRLCRGKHRDRVRPILINNWEATYFNFDAQKLESLADEAQRLGIELFVLDDGWFGHRDDDTSSLGDWQVDKRKLPDGLADLAERIRARGMEFGLWFEPEMISEDSHLYREHPDWCIQVEGRPKTWGRNQFVLDLSRPEVCDYIVRVITEVLNSAPISYVKWDMNRHLTEVGSLAWPPERQREIAHRYILGLYHVLEQITSSFPDILFESCSGGGGRFDPGMLFYMPQTWASDNSDAVSRLNIQYGTSLVYPISTIGAHVSVIPNHQVHRVTSLDIRSHVAMSGNLGFELDLTKLSEEEKNFIRKMISQYKEIRSVIQFGDFYRLLDPFQGNEAAWMFVSENKNEAVVGYFKVLAQPGERIRFLRLNGLHPDAKYKHVETGRIYGGDELMHVGLTIPVMHGDFTSVFYRFQQVELT